MKLFTKDLYPALLTIIAVIIIDQITKIVISNNVLYTTIYELSFFKIKYALNTGVAFSLFTGINDILRFIMPIAAIFLFVLLVTYKDNKLLKYAFSLQIGGAIGNLYDRIFYKAVPDFIDFHVGNFHWFIFNVSDIFITLGVLLMITLELIGYKKEVDEKI